jgi:hypothetical protein
MKKVFVSYSGEDREKAAELVDALRKEEDIKVWFDRDEILPGDDFLDEMKEGIEECDKFIICLSPAFDEKPPQSWVRQELRMAILSENVSGRRIIIPVRLKRGGGIPRELGARAYADISSPQRWEKNFPRLIKAIQK